MKANTIMAIDKNRPMAPGIFKSLSKQGLDAMPGRIMNKIPGEYRNSRLNSLSAIIGTCKIENNHSMIKTVMNHPLKFNGGTL